jgi:hypothetical protein
MGVNQNVLWLAEIVSGIRQPEPLCGCCVNVCGAKYEVALEVTHCAGFPLVYEILMEGSDVPEWGFHRMVPLHVANRGIHDSWGKLMEGEPKGSAVSVAQCAVCGSHRELFELPGRKEKYCYECSADVATSILLTTEIDAATRSGEETDVLKAEFVKLSRRILERAQLR